MAPTPTIPTLDLRSLDDSSPHLYRRNNNTYGDWRDVDKIEAYIVEGWGEGFMLGALLIMAVITIANMRKGVILHKLILFELLFAMSHGTFAFMGFNGYGWYLSSTAALLYCSYFTHNVVAWLKIRPFFTPPQASFGPKACKWVTWVYLSSLACTIPVHIFEIFNNFRYFNNLSKLYERVRPYEPLMRDPWWIFSCLTLFHVIRRVYSLNVFKLVRKSPRFGILLAAIILAIIFTIMDILASIIPRLSITDGINPYWKLALVFKCLTDNIMLDDFKSVLQRLGALKLDGTTAMQANSMNMSPNEKAGLSDHDEVEDASASPWSSCQRERSRSLSGRELEEGETLDDSGRGRRKQSMAAGAVGKLGMKIRRLPGIPSQSRAEREAQRNAMRNKTISETSESGPSDELAEERPPWEQMDFITALDDPRMDDAARRK